MREFLERTKLMTEVMAVLMIILGIMLVINPGDAVLLVCRLVGVVLTVTGLVLLIMSLNNRRGLDRGNSLDIFLCVLGIFLLAVGLFIVFRPGIVVGFVSILFALILFVHGIGDVREMLSLRRMGYERWRVSLLCAVVTFLMGLFLLISPFKSTSIMMALAGIFLILDGVSELCIAFRVISLRKTYHPGDSGEIIEGHAEEIEKR